MPKKATDPFMDNLWSALVADKLGPGGHETGWDETPVRVRNRFIQAVRQVMQSGAAFQASMAVGESKAASRLSGKKATQKARSERELLLPLMTNVSASERPAKKTRR
jgi:hypothetical protein